MNESRRVHASGPSTLTTRDGRRFRGQGEVLLVSSGDDARIAFVVRKALRKRAGTAAVAAVRRTYPTVAGGEIEFADGTVLEFGGSSAIALVLEIQALRPGAGWTLSSLARLAEEYLSELEDDNGAEGDPEAS